MLTGSQKYSRTVSKTLDNLGYNQNIIRYRRQHYDKSDMIANETRRQFFSRMSVTSMKAGSKTEGLTAPWESDQDTMQILGEVLCSDCPWSKFYQFKSNLTIFQTEMTKTCPGYTRLQQIKVEKNFPLKDAILKENNWKSYLSSELSVESYRKSLKLDACPQGISGKRTKRKGPACAHIPGITSFNFEMDDVLSLPCVCPDLLHAYLFRRRKYDWPTLEMLKTISKMDAHVVPVGFKGSPYSNIEWRICFTTAEIALIRSLNDTQTKLYILLKMVSKSIIKKICPDITSYVMKNIVLWMAETNSQLLFTEDQLLDRLTQSLYFLKVRVEAKFIPSYMIPERDLLAGRMDSTQQQQLVSVLDSLIQKQQYLVLQIPKLHRGLAIMYSRKDEALAIGKKRKKAEKLMLAIIEMIAANRLKIGITGDKLIEWMVSPQTESGWLEELEWEYDVRKMEKQKRLTTRKLYSLLLPDWKDHEHYKQIFKEKLKKILS